MLNRDLPAGNHRRKMKMKAELKIRRFNVVTLVQEVVVKREKHTDEV